MTAPRNSVKIRRACFDAHSWADPLSGRIMLTCWICQGPIDPVRQKWEAEHSVRRSVGGSDDPSNVLPAHTECHAPKTRLDNITTAKGKRIRDKHFGIVRKQGFRKVPPGYVFDWKAKRYVKAESESQGE